MKSYLIDTNFILRFLLKDPPQQSKTVREYFNKAKIGKISIRVSIIVFVELNFALMKFYRISKSEIIDKLALIAQIPYLDIEMREIVLRALNIYSKYSIEFVDSIFLAQSELTGKELLTFDQKLKSLRFKTLKLPSTTIPV